jgi:hypothetical protein
VKTASVTFATRSESCARRQAETRNCIEVRPTWANWAKTVTSSPTLTGRTNAILSTATVAHRPRAWRAAAFPAARSIWDSNHPPKISPAGFVSAGMAMVRIAGSQMGCVSNSALATFDIRSFRLTSRLRQIDTTFIPVFCRHDSTVALDVKAIVYELLLKLGAGENNLKSELETCPVHNPPNLSSVTRKKAPRARHGPAQLLH